MYFTFFPEFLHLEQLKSLGLTIKIQYPNYDKMCDSDKPSLKVIYEHNLKLLFEPTNPPSNDILQKLQQEGFNLTFTGKDRWVFIHNDAKMQEIDL